MTLIKAPSNFARPEEGGDKGGAAFDGNRWARTKRREGEFLVFKALFFLEDKSTDNTPITCCFIFVYRPSMKM